MPSPKSSSMVWKQFVKGVKHQAAMKHKLNADAPEFIFGKTIVPAEPKGNKKGSANVRTAKRGGKRSMKRTTRKSRK